MLILICCKKELTKKNMIDLAGKQLKSQMMDRGYKHCEQAKGKLSLGRMTGKGMAKPQ